MKTYIVTLRIQDEDDISPSAILDAITDTASDVTPGFEILSIAEEKAPKKVLRNADASHDPTWRA